jgi:hypothetical protein
MRQGWRPELAALDGWRFRGLGAGRAARLFGRQKFLMVFQQMDLGYGTVLGGHLLDVVQNDPADDYLPRLQEGREVAHGVFLVQSARTSPEWSEFPRAALLHFGRADNAWYEPARFRRQYVVQPDPGNHDLYLGKAYVAVGPLRYATGHFVLERFERVRPAP